MNYSPKGPNSVFAQKSPPRVRWGRRGVHPDPKNREESDSGLRYQKIVRFTIVFAKTKTKIDKRLYLYSFLPRDSLGLRGGGRFA